MSDQGFTFSPDFPWENFWNEGNDLGNSLSLSRKVWDHKEGPDFSYYGLIHSVAAEKHGYSPLCFFYDTLPLSTDVWYICQTLLVINRNSTYKYSIDHNNMVSILGYWPSFISPSRFHFSGSTHQVLYSSGWCKLSSLKNMSLYILKWCFSLNLWNYLFRNYFLHWCRKFNKLFDFIWLLVIIHLYILFI